ncbi:MAG: beta-L-arabinofuranosidase domain-containing protein, partial [Acidobacteriaceae bacterium]
MRKRFTRRNFLKTGMAAAAAGALTPRILAQSAMLPSAPANKGATVFSQFHYSDVELLEGPMLDQFRTNHQFFLALDEDALLKPFRQKAGLPAPGPDMGGWYSWSDEFDPPNNMTGYIPGHSFGQYLSGLARDYAATGDKPTQAKISRLVRGFAQTITPKFYEG